MADGIKSRIGGVWKDLTPSIKVGGVWKTPDAVHIRVGGVWKEVWTDAPEVSLPVLTLTSIGVTTAYSGIQLAADGIIYKHPASGTTAWEDTGSNWLISGTNAEVWVECTYTAGTGSPSLYASDLGNGTRLALTTDRIWQIRDTTSTGGKVTGTVLLELYDAASGGNLLTSRTYTLDANYAPL